MTTEDKATPADEGPDLERGVGQPAPQRASTCGLTECRGKPMCARCTAWEKADAAGLIDVDQVVYALERAERRLQSEADRLHDAGDYSAEFPAEDAARMREAITLLRARSATISPSALLPAERECCGTLHGSRHRATCAARKLPNG